MACAHAMGLAADTMRDRGDVAEWLRSGLQSRLHRFDSGRRLGGCLLVVRRGRLAGYTVRSRFPRRAGTLALGSPEALEPGSGSLPAAQPPVGVLDRNGQAYASAGQPTDAAVALCGPAGCCFVALRTGRRGRYSAEQLVDQGTAPLGVVQERSVTPGHDLEVRVGDQPGGAPPDLRAAVGVPVSPDHQHGRRDVLKPSVGEEVLRAGSPRMPGSATAGTPSDATALTRPGASTARQSAHMPPSEVPMTGTRPRSSASSSDASCATAWSRSDRPL
jgi:hypothetical protein